MFSVSWLESFFGGNLFLFFSLRRYTRTAKEWTSKYAMWRHCLESSWKISLLVQAKKKKNLGSCLSFSLFFVLFFLLIRAFYPVSFPTCALIRRWCFLSRTCAGFCEVYIPTLFWSLKKKTTTAKKHHGSEHLTWACTRQFFIPKSIMLILYSSHT